MPGCLNYKLHGLPIGIFCLILQLPDGPLARANPLPKYFSQREFSLLQHNLNSLAVGHRVGDTSHGGLGGDADAQPACTPLRGSLLQRACSPPQYLKIALSRRHSLISTGLPLLLNFYYSGHTGLMLFSALLWRRLGYRILELVTYPLLVIVVLVLLITRVHYIIDIIGGVVFTLSIDRFLLPRVVWFDYLFTCMYNGLKWIYTSLKRGVSQ